VERKQLLILFYFFLFLSNIFIYIYSFLVLGFRTKGFALARQIFNHFSLAPSSLLIVIFSDKVWYLLPDADFGR
jgi:hypothetical protein